MYFDCFVFIVVVFLISFISPFVLCCFFNSYLIYFYIPYILVGGVINFLFTFETRAARCLQRG